MAAQKKTEKNTKKTLPYVVLRADSGVYCGTRLSETPNGDGRMTVKLRNFRRIWRWFGFEGTQAVHTVEDISVYGVGPTSKVSSVASEITIADARCSVTCGVAARKILEAATWSP